MASRNAHFGRNILLRGDLPLLSKGVRPSCGSWSVSHSIKFHAGQAHKLPAVRLSVSFLTFRWFSHHCPTALPWWVYRASMVWTNPFFRPCTRKQVEKKSKKRNKRIKTKCIPRKSNNILHFSTFFWWSGDWWVLCFDFDVFIIRPS